MINPADCITSDIVMESSGVLDLAGESVSTACQMKAAVQNLQGTMIIPHGGIPLTDYNNP